MLMTASAGMFSLEKANIFLPRSFREAPMCQISSESIIRKRSWHFLQVLMSIGGILAVMLLQVKLQLAADSLSTDVGYYAGITLAEHQQHRLVDIVVYQQD